MGAARRGGGRGLSADGAPTWFPCNDRAADKATYRVTLTTPATHLGLVNGVVVETQVRGSSTSRTFEQAEPTSPYLMTVHVGPYQVRVLRDGPVPLNAVLTAADVSAFDTAFARLPEMFDVYVDLFGPYPFASGYTVVICPEDLEIPLEAQGQATFGRNHLDGASERLIAHELSHQWFGNSVTARSWRHIWLHEGFACYAEWLWSERSGGRSSAELARRHHGALAAEPQGLLLSDPGPVDMFEDWVYKRGALTLHVLRGELGDDRFFDLLRRWTMTHRHATATSGDFEAMAMAAAGPDLRETVADLFQRWLHRPELPDLPNP